MIESSRLSPALKGKKAQPSKNNTSDRVIFDPFYPGKITKQTEKKTDRKTKQQQKFKKIKIIFENSQF